MWTDSENIQYQSLTDTLIWKLGLRPRNSFSGNYITGIFVAVRRNNCILTDLLKYCTCTEQLVKQTSLAEFLKKDRQSQGTATTTSLPEAL
jgi:hypothetical protein